MAELNFSFRFGRSGSGEGRFGKPFGLVVDKEGNIYVADTKNNRIQKFDPSGKFLLKLGAVGEMEFSSPTGVAVDS
jgi:DNA-binding beta-propeller fold protein YncE